MRHIQQFIILCVCSQLTIIWVHRFVIIDYNSYHLWKCECWIRQERKMRTIFFSHTDRERINSSYFNIFFLAFSPKKFKIVAYCGIFHCLKVNLSLFFFLLWWNIKKEDLEIPCCSQSTLLQKAGSNITVCLSIARIVCTINEGGAII